MVFFNLFNSVAAFESYLIPCSVFSVLSVFKLLTLSKLFQLISLRSTRYNFSFSHSQLSVIFYNSALITCSVFWVSEFLSFSQWKQLKTFQITDTFENFYRFTIFCELISSNNPDPQISQFSHFLFLGFLSQQGGVPQHWSRKGTNERPMRRGGTTALLHITLPLP